MNYQTGGMELGVIREVFRGSLNDVLICRDILSPVNARYVLLVVHNRECAKKLLSVFEASVKEPEEGNRPYLLSFSQNEHLCFLFDYKPERRLSAFATGQMTSLFIREKTCINLVMECLSSPLPYPLLHLLLEQESVHIEKDNSIYFTPYFDLEGLDPDAGEGMCCISCVKIIIRLLEGTAGQHPRSLLLLRKKVDRGAYSSFPELYRDIKVTAVPEKKEKLSKRLKGFWIRNRDRLFRVLLILCGVVIAVTLILLVSLLLFGDVPLFRLFENTFDVIGTETLHR